MDNNQHTTDWTTRLQQLQRIQQSIAEYGFLGEALAQTRTFLTHFHYESSASQLEEIEENYRLMCDFFRQGYPDERRHALYEGLSIKLYRLLKDVELGLRKTHDPSVMAYIPGRSKHVFDIDSIRGHLEAFVSDVAMASLDPEEQRTAKIHALHAAHHQYLQELFAHLLFAPLWSHEFAMGMACLIVSPTTDTHDAQLLASAIMLGAMLSGDTERLLSLLHVYRQAREPRVKQRALVGWVLAMQSQGMHIFRHVEEQIEDLIADEHTRQQLLELQIQLIYCRNAKRDNEHLQKDIMPNLIRNQNLEVTGFDIREKDESTLDDILHPDATDRKMEEMEQSIRKMMDMRDQGVDIYFGGFSKMKRFGFFYTLSNWFAPFYPEHPQLQHITRDFLQSNMVRAILGSNTFCESDKYSFVLGTSSVYHNLPANIREMLNSGEVSMMGMPAHDIDSRDESYIRRMYLQDLYRFFSLCDAHKMLDNPFESDQFLFLAHDAFIMQMGSEARRVQKFLLKQKMYSSLNYLFYAYREPDNTDDMRMEAHLKMHDGNYYQAQAIYARLCELLPLDERAMTGYAQASFYIEDYTEAASTYAQLYDLHPDNRRLALNLAISRINALQVDEGMKLLYRLAYDAPDDYSVKRAMAWGHLWLKHIDQAEKIYQELLSHNDCTAADRLNAAYCQWFAGQTDLAITLFRQSAASADSSIKTAGDLMQQFSKDTALIATYDIGYIEQKLMAELAMASLRQQ